MGVHPKGPVGRHVRRRVNRQKMAWFRKKIRQLVETRRRQGYTITVQDESIILADARPRKGVYTPKGVRATYTYTGSHSKTIVFGVITSDDRGLFGRYDKFTKDEFVDFVEGPRKVWQDADHCRPGPQHRAKIVLKALEEMKGAVEMAFLPPGCPI